MKNEFLKNANTPHSIPFHCAVPFLFVVPSVSERLFLFLGDDALACCGKKEMETESDGSAAGAWALVPRLNSSSRELLPALRCCDLSIINPPSADVIQTDRQTYRRKKKWKNQTNHSHRCHLPSNKKDDGLDKFQTNTPYLPTHSCPHPCQG